MSEQAAAVMICCMPSTAAFFKSAKVPVRSWLSSVSGRALRLTGSNRSDMPNSGSQSNLKGSLESGWNAAYSNQQSHDHNGVWVDTEFDAYSMRKVSQQRTPPSVGV